MKRVVLIATLAVSSAYAAITPKVIYGVDNRFELRNSPFASLRNSVAGMVKKSNLALNSEAEEFDVKYFSDMTYYRGTKTCADIKFREQATLPSCTGFLVSEDILITAGHCMVNYSEHVIDSKDNDNCKNNSWVFGFEDTTENEDGIKFKRDDIYECESIIEASYKSDSDFAVIKLNRKTIDKEVVMMNTNNLNYDIGSDIFVVGHPTGLPLKVAGGAKVYKNVGANKFVSNLDTFAGNSGSPIFNMQKEVIGILVSGETDYYFDKKDKCIRPNSCDGIGEMCSALSFPFKPASGETGTKIHLATKAIKDYEERLAKKLIEE